MLQETKCAKTRCAKAVIGLEWNHGFLRPHAAFVNKVTFRK